MKTQYKRGYAIELKARDELRKAGYYVIRSSGSHGLFDLVAIGKNIVKLIQIKRQTKSKKIKEEAEIEKLIVPVNCIKEIWIWDSKNKEWEKEIIMRLR